MDEIKTITSFSVNISIFRVISIWRPEPYKSKWSHRVYGLYTLCMNGIFHVSFLMTQIMYMVKYWGNLEEMSKVLFFMLTVLGQNAKMYHYIFSPTKIRNLLAELQTLNLLTKNRKQYETALKGMKTVKRNALIFISMCCSTVALWSIFPVLDGSIKNYGLPFIGWFPYRYDRSPQYELTYLYITMSIMYSALVNSGFDTFVAGFMVHAGTLLDNLTHSLENIKVNEQENTEETIMKQVTVCIEHYNNIIRFIEHVEQLFTYPIMAQFSVSGFVICVTMFQLTMLSAFSFEFFTLALYQGCIIIQLFLYCWFGNEIILKSTILPTSIYNSDWYKCDSQKYRKTMLRFMLRLQKPAYIRAAYFFPLSVNTFLKIMQSGWSYFALLRTMKEDP